MPLPQQVIGIDTSGLPGPRVLTVQGIGPGGSFANPPVPYDSQLFGNSASGGVVTIQFPATPNKRWMIQSFIFSISGATAGGNTLAFISDSVPTNFLIHRLIVAVGNTTILEQSSVAITGGLGQAVNLGFSGANAGVYVSVSAGAYLI